MTETFVSPMTGGERADAELATEVNRKAGPFIELGQTGLKRTGGYLDEEFLPQLKGRKAIQVYREMSDNDPIIGAMLFAIDKLIREADWQVTPAGKSKDHAAAARLVETAKDDMSHSWDELISEILSCIIFGWSWHEIVYKRRQGPWQREGRLRSKYSDGLIGWRKIPIRSQETMQRWLFDESGGIQGMLQLAPPTFKLTPLPIERSLLFRYGSYKNSPEGRSMLRNAYRPWYYKKRLEEFESIGVERDLAGLPMVKVPAAWLKATPGTEPYKMVQAMQKMVRSIRRNEQEGIIFPQSYDVDTKQPNFEFELLGGGGARAFNTNELIQRYEQRILMTALADFIMVGHQRVGTYNLHLDKTGIFKSALNALVRAIADIFNRHAIPRLFAINGWKPDELPTLTPSDVDAPDIAQLGAFLTQTAGLGFTWAPDADLEKYLRSAAGLPELGDDDYRSHRREARREEATRYAESQTRYLAARSQLAQMMASQQLQSEGTPQPADAAALGETKRAQTQDRRAGEAHDTSQVTANLTNQQQLAQMLGQGAQNGSSSNGTR